MYSQLLLIMGLICAGSALIVSSNAEHPSTTTGCPNCSKIHSDRREPPPVGSTPVPTSNGTDPFSIARRKCVEYGATRYANKTMPGKLLGKPPVVIRILDCVDSRRITPGPTATPKEFPHMALIGFIDHSDRIEDATWDCGGSLISERFVLSAAHCVIGGKREAKWVRIGDLRFDGPNNKSEMKNFRIIQRITHPNYTTNSAYNDIALLKLHTNVTFTSFIRPICLYTASSVSPDFTRKALKTSWTAPFTGESTRDLLRTSVNLLDDHECKTNYKNDKLLKNGYDSLSMMCADYPPGRDTCLEDSGGPLQIPIPNRICLYSQIGISSYGDSICDKKGVNNVIIYTKISYFVPWIQSIVWPQ